MRGQLPELPADRLARWWLRPQDMVRELFGATPDPWQDAVLEAFPHKQRIAMRACKNPGKTCVEAWCAWNYLLTRPHPRILATSVTGDNLSAGLWAEMAKWQHESLLLQSAFTWTKTRIFANDNPATWWMGARTWPKTASIEEQQATLAGIHGDYTLAIIDECGTIPTAVLVAAEAMLGSGKEGHVLIGGNTNNSTGILYEAVVTNASKWHIVPVTGDPDDPNRSTRVNIQWARDLIERYGRDNPHVMVEVLGQFPQTSFNTLLSMDDIRASQRRSWAEQDIASHPRIMGVDVALSLGGDASVIFPRQGLVAFAPERHRGIAPHLGAARVASRWGEWDADAVFIDNTGGYGASWISHLQLMKRAPIGVGFSESPNDGQFANKRAEIYWLAAEWVRNGGQLPSPNVPGMIELAAALTQTTYTAKRDKLILEPKELISDRLGYSPDDADAFALTFAHPVAPRMVRSGQRNGLMAAEYDPFAEVNKSPMVGRMMAHYDPMR